MYRTSLSSLTSTLVGAAKHTFSEFKPTSENLVTGAFNQLAQQGIANLSYRSPILATLAQSALHNFQSELTNKRQLQDYIKSDKASWLREHTKEKLGGSASPEKINQEMLKVISKMNSAIDKEGVEATKKSGLFKEYEKYFKEFSQQPQQESDPENVVGSDGKVLTRIEGNTQRTVSVLEELAVRGNLAGSTTQTNTSSGSSFIDPMTGMPSITAAVGAIGGNFLGKIFDNATIEKFANKAKSIFDDIINDDKDPIQAEKKTSAATVVNELVKKANTDKDNSKVISVGNVNEAAKEGITKVSTENTSESAKELFAESHNHAEKLQKTVEESLDELKKIAVATSKEESLIETNLESKKPKKEGLVDKALEKGKEKVIGKIQERISKGMPGAGRFVKSVDAAKVAEVAESGGLLAGAARFGGSLLTGAGALIAGGAGYAPGTMLNPLIDKGISAATGKENTLGGWIYDKVNPDTISALPKTSGKIISELTEAKSKQELAKANKQSPQVIALNSNSSSVAPASTQPIIVGSSVRNKDSTFERVQMQDFWPRTS
jgi:hypothetical protein